MGLKEKLFSSGGCASGGLSILGSGPVCHSACMGIATALSAVGHGEAQHLYTNRICPAAGGWT